MARNLEEVYLDNPSTMLASDDLIYTFKSPYGPTNDSGIKHSDYLTQLNSAVQLPSSTKVTGLDAQLAAKQPLDATLTALAALNATAGTLTQTGADTFTKRTLTGTTNRVTITNGDGVSGNPVFDISSSYAGQATIVTVGTLTTGVWNAGVIGGEYGGTGINNGSRTITYGGNLSFANSFTTAGNFAVTQTYTAATNATFPAGTVTLASTAQLPFATTLTDNLVIPNSSTLPPKRTWYLNVGGNKTVTVPTVPIDGEEHEFFNLFAGAAFFGIALPNGVGLKGGLFNGVSNLDTALVVHVDTTTGTTVFKPVDTTKTGQQLTLKWCAAQTAWLIGSNFGYTF